MQTSMNTAVEMSSQVYPISISQTGRLGGKSKCNYYEITKEGRRSEAAKILFARHRDTQQDVVIKVLCEYKDTRYNLRTIGQRQQCQLEALRWNQRFTSGVYHGLGSILAPLVDKEMFPGDVICLSELYNDAQEAQKNLDAEKEYALVMNLLPEDQRLDNLLEFGEASEDVLRALLEVLVERVVDMHEYWTAPTDSDEHGCQWGEIAQIQRKLEHNLGLLDLIPGAVKDDQQYREYYWLKDALREVIKLPQYANYFQLRRRAGYIRRCHGDLKTTNIWVNIGGGGGPWILDAIDFNPHYSNIDVLSDLAMLVVDIEVRTRYPALAEGIIQNYLRLTNQIEDEVLQGILVYYLIEKAIVRAAVSIVYDDLAELGLQFLKVAEKYMRKLKKLCGTPTDATNGVQEWYLPLA